MANWKEVEISSLEFNPFEKIGKEWMLITAGKSGSYNTMTASWGGMGVLWGKNVTFAFIRPQRYTLEFVDREEYYTLSFFPKEYKPALAYCGAHSGRDVDKEQETGLTPVFDESAPYFEQANLVFVCRKLHRQQIDPACFLSLAEDKEWYPEKDYHYVFTGEIVKVLKRD